MSFLSRAKDSLPFISKKPKPKRTIGGELKDWILSLVAALVVYFVILPVFLHTSSPLVIVSSCSEKGYLAMGDILVLQGIDIKDIKAPEVQLDSLDSFEAMMPILDNKGEAVQLAFGNKTVSLDRSSDIIVYRAFPFGFDVIHRVFAKININGTYYLITKGDANNMPDQWSNTYYMTPCIKENYGCISTPVTQKMLIGKNLVGVPLLGHLKLFFCDLLRFCDGHANLGTNYTYTLSC